MNSNIISTYTSKEAEEDGILFDITTLNPAWERGFLKYITTSLLSSCGYMDKGKLNLPNLLDLLNQCNQLVRKASNGFKVCDTFFAVEIELPSGQAQEVFIAQNETGKFTIMLPEDR